MRIIVLVDFSLYTRSLIQVATNWAKLLNAGLVLVHEVPQLVPAMAGDTTRYQIIEYEKEEAFAKLRDLAKRNIPDHIAVNYEVTEIDLTTFLPKLIPSQMPTLFMLGLKGTGLIKRVFIGSMFTDIINELNKITIGVPIKISQAIPEHLIVPVNEEYVINEEKLDQLITYLRPSLHNIEFVSIERSAKKNILPTDYLQELSNNFNGSISATYRSFKGKKAFEEFKTYAANNENSFLVLQKGGRSLNDQVYRKFFINHIVHDGSIPLIVLPG